MIVPSRYCMLLGVLLLSGSGCKTMVETLPEKIPFTPQSMEAKAKAENPVRMAVIWTEATLNRPGQTPTRGFGGRVYFYSQENVPIQVKGEFVVNAFDDSIEEDAKQQPDRKYVYTSQQLSGHHSETTIGDSYSIWIPWGAAQGQRKEISLLPIFKPETGAVIVGNQSRNILPGDAPHAANEGLVGNASTRQSAAVRNVAYDSELRSGASAIVSRTTTISVPQGLSRRMAAATSQQYWARKKANSNLADRSATQQTTAGQTPQQHAVNQLPAKQPRLINKASANESRPLNSAQAGATLPAPRRTGQPSTRFSRPRPQVQREPIGRLSGVDARWQPRPEARPSSLPFSRQSYQTAPPTAGSW